MIDDNTGHRVIVWGVEGQDMPDPTEEELRWKPAKSVAPGEISDQAWYRILQSGQERDAASYSDSVEEDDEASFSEDEDNSHLSSKSYEGSDTRSLATKGLFSRLNVQSLRSRKKLGSGSVPGFDIVKDNKMPRKQGPEASSPLLDAESEGYKRVPKAPKGAKSSRTMTSEDFFSIRSFKDVGASELITQTLNSLQVKQPTQIQAMAYQHVLKGCSCILADQTGSGKTLAYLAPLFHRLLKEEEQGSSKSFPKRPRCLIMVPTSELAAQVHNVCRAFSRGGACLKSMVVTGGFKLKTQVDSLEDSPDILVATAGRFLQLLNSGSLALDNLSSVVLDEVDVLFDDPEFSDALKGIEDYVSVKTQYIHVTATLPVDVWNVLLEKHPDAVPLMGRGLHCTATGLQEVLVDCSGDGEKTPETAFENKKRALLQLVEQQSVFKTVVFCNKIETCRKVENVLKRFDRKGNKFCVLSYHAALSLEARLQSMRQFINADSEKRMFLVCTDRASRGLDLVDVEHVVLFDFPRDPSEYVRRVGRTARAGGGGKAFVFVVGKQVTLARKIMVRNEKGHPVHTVPSHSY